VAGVAAEHRLVDEMRGGQLVQQPGRLAGRRLDQRRRGLGADVRPRPVSASSRTAFQCISWIARTAAGGNFKEALSAPEQARWYPRAGISALDIALNFELTPCGCAVRSRG